MDTWQKIVIALLFAGLIVWVLVTAGSTDDDVWWGRAHSSEPYDYERDGL